MEENSKLVLKGVLVSGLGEGKYYMSKDVYKNGFKDTLGYIPWPGTFNIKINPIVDIEKKPLIIKGFKEDGEVCGNINCYPVVIVGNENIKAHLMIPEINKHEGNIIELISPKYLRKTLNIKDGEEVIVELK